MPGLLICLFISWCCYSADNNGAAEVWAWLGGAIIISGYIIDYFSVYMAV